MKLTDGKRTIGIEMIGLNGIDWTADFYNAGTLEQVEDAFKVDDVQEAVSAAVDYCNHQGDYDEITDTETKLYVNGELVAESKEK